MWSLTGLLNDLAKKERSCREKEMQGYSWEGNRQKILRKKVFGNKSQKS